MLSQKTVESLLACRDSEIARLIIAFESITALPYAEPEWLATDSEGIKVRCRTAGPFAIGYWLDREAREVRIQTVDLLGD